MNQLKTGTRIEREHLPTMRFIRRYVKKTGRLPTNGLVYRHIAMNHIAEHKNYYTKLRKAKLWKED